jgi:hypothetical protein
VWLFLGLGCAVMLLLCCGGLVGSSIYFAKNSFQVVDDPEAAKQEGSQIAEFDLPAGFKADKAVTVKIPFSGQVFMTIVVYNGPNNEPGVSLMEFGQIMANADRDQLRMQMDEQMQKQGQQMKKLTVAESHDVEVQIHGQPATFKIQRAEDAETKQEFVQIEGVFQGKRGPAILLGQLKADTFTEDDAEKLVRSIK